MPVPIFTVRENPWTTVAKDIIQALAICVAALWGVYTFIYKEIIVPSRAPASLVVTPTLEEIGRRGDTVMVRATFTMENHSGAKVYAPAMWYSVRGLKLQSAATEDTTYLREVREGAEKPYPTSRFSQFVAADVIGTGKLTSEVETWYEPNAAQKIEQLLYVPADRYDAAQLAVQVLLTRSVDDVKQVRWKTTDDGELEPTLVFKDGSTYAGTGPAALNASEQRYVRWLRANNGGVNFVTATISLWNGRSAPRAAAAPQTP